MHSCTSYDLTYCDSHIIIICVALLRGRTATVAYYALVEAAAAAAVVNVNGAARVRRRCVMTTTKRSSLPTEGVVLDSPYIHNNDNNI